MGGRNSKEDSLEHLFPSERTNRLRTTRASGLGSHLHIPPPPRPTQTRPIIVPPEVTNKSIVTILPPPASRSPPPLQPLPIQRNPETQSSMPVRNPEALVNIPQPQQSRFSENQAPMPILRNPNPASIISHPPPPQIPPRRVRISDDLRFMPLVPVDRNPEVSSNIGKPPMQKSVPNRPFVQHQPDHHVRTENARQPIYGNNGPDRGDYQPPGQLRLSSSGSEDKRKLIIRGLKKFKESRGCSAPMWVKEFPCRSRFHPDNYIYDFNEGPNVPKRSTDAMNKCPLKGGRCDRCGIYTGDICVKCRRCDKDCECRPGGPCGQMDPRVGGTWTAAEKFLSELNRFPAQGPNTAPEQYPFNTNSGIKPSGIPGPPPAPTYFPPPPQPPTMSPVPIGNIYGYPPCYPPPPSPYGYPYPPNYGMYPPPPPMGYYPPPPQNYPPPPLAYGYPSPPPGFGGGYDKSSAPPVFNSYVSVNAPDPPGTSY